MAMHGLARLHFVSMEHLRRPTSVMAGGPAGKVHSAGWRRGQDRRSQLMPNPRHRQGLAEKGTLYLLTRACDGPGRWVPKMGFRQSFYGEGAGFQAFGYERSFRGSPEISSPSGAPGEPPCVPHQLGWGRWFNRVGETAILAAR